MKISADNRTVMDCLIFRLQLKDINSYTTGDFMKKNQGKQIIFLITYC